MQTYLQWNANDVTRRHPSTRSHDKALRYWHTHTPLLLASVFCKEFEMKIQPLCASAQTPDFCCVSQRLNFFQHFPCISPKSWMSPSVHDTLAQLTCPKPLNFYQHFKAAGLQAADGGKPHAGAFAPSKQLQWRVWGNITQSYSLLYIHTHIILYLSWMVPDTAGHTSQPHNITSCHPHFSLQWTYWFGAPQFPLGWTMWWAHKVRPPLPFCSSKSVRLTWTHPREIYDQSFKIKKKP